MGLLDRYRKPGGFQQLLSLIESFAPAKQDKFITMIEEEDRRWAQALREKMLNVERVLNWPSATLSEIYPHFTPRMMAIALHGLAEAQRQNFLKGLSHQEKHKLEQEMAEVSPPPGEVSAAHFKLLDLVRQMLGRGELRADSFDAVLVIDEDFETRLLQAAPSPSPSPSTSSAAGEPSVATGPVAAGGSAESSADTKAMQALVVNLQRENKSLKAELKTLKDKLEQIRKIA